MSEQEDPVEETKIRKPKKRTFKTTKFDKHVPNCVYERVIYKNGQYVYEKWLFRKADYPCGSCGNTRGVVFMRVAPLNVVIQSCTSCGTTTPVEPRIDNIDHAYPLEVKVVSMEDAKEILIRNKCKPKYLPPELERAFKAQDRPKVTPDELDDLDLEED